jgi:hypothetical protein
VATLLAVTGAAQAKPLATADASAAHVIRFFIRDGIRIPVCFGATRRP